MKMENKSPSVLSTSPKSEVVGWYTWGNFGDGLWRASRNGRQENFILPQATREAAEKLAAQLYETSKMSSENYWLG